MVLEQDLSDVVTHSVGQSFIGDKVLSYCGDQYLTNDAHGEDVYGGSNLLVVQGGYDELLKLDLPDDVRLAIEQAQVFDAAANEAYPRFYASRRNYDIAQGLDSNGKTAAVCSNNRGAWAVPAVLKSPRCKASSTIRGCARSVCLR